MDIILGAGGQVGSEVSRLLESRSRPVRRVLHCSSETKDKRQTPPNSGSETVAADYFDGESLKKAFSGGDTVLLLTPENITSQNMIADAEIVFENYRAALENSRIRRVVGLSSMGAQLSEEAGMLQLYAMLEKFLDTLDNTDIEIFIIRPAYYYSNWMMFADTAQKEGVLPTYFPPEQSFPMIAPKDAAALIADIMENGAENKITETAGPELYNPSDIARFFGGLFGKEITPMTIPYEEWYPGLLQAGFSENAAELMTGMTKTVADGKSDFTIPPVRTKTTFSIYLEAFK
ncbi:hypothetical protein MmiAt1_17730 [Methanimicrococcus sp. At1]|uniref:NmrA-like domain-containing protein n=1 Tax=Methanimicrococcus hacksteinii TaxID=3028293 RepID=A0ABU3VTC6_9EURY|nr:NAD(P)H-binding protein [Methanimicrococcus sp. At1]MDV0446155.1 hypothetical protein [Methanimicrococcus sp. At1]